MADVKKINGYNIKDETARNAINNLAVKSETLLWTNDAPASNQGEKDIALNLSNYDGVKIVSYTGVNNANTYYVEKYIPKGYSGVITADYANAYDSSHNSFGHYLKPITVSSNNVHLGQGWVYIATPGIGTSVNTNNDRLVVQKIYGIK